MRVNPTYYGGDLRRDLLEEALALIAAEGPSAVSLRSLARRLGVSMPLRPTTSRTRRRCSPPSPPRASSCWPRPSRTPSGGPDRTPPRPGGRAGLRRLRPRPSGPLRGDVAARPAAPARPGPGRGRRRHLRPAAGWGPRGPGRGRPRAPTPRSSPIWPGRPCTAWPPPGWAAPPAAGRPFDQLAGEVATLLGRAFAPPSTPTARADPTPPGPAASPAAPGRPTAPAGPATPSGPTAPGPAVPRGPSFEKERSQCTASANPIPTAGPAGRPGAAGRRCRARAGGRPAGRPSRGRAAHPGRVRGADVGGLDRPHRRRAGGAGPDLPTLPRPARPAPASAAAGAGLPIRTYLAVIALLWVIWLVTGASYPWPIWPMLGWGIGVVGRHKGAWAGR